MFPLMMFVVAQCPMGHLVLCAAPRTTWKLPCKSTGHLQQLKVSSAEEVLMRFVRMTYVMCFTDRFCLGNHYWTFDKGSPNHWTPHAVILFTILYRCLIYITDIWSSKLALLLYSPGVWQQRRASTLDCCYQTGTSGTKAMYVYTTACYIIIQYY